jgi:hypothetical protein
MNQPNDKKVVWDPETESYKVVSNPEWDIEAEVGIYSSLVQGGVNDALAADIVSMFNTTRPVYPCYCYTEHTEIGYGFNPCPCLKCEKLANAEGYDISEPVDSIQLHKNTVHVVGYMIEQQLSRINEVIGSDNIHISEDDFGMFQSLLEDYGKTDLSWSEILDYMAVDPRNSSDQDHFYAVAAILEYFWIAFVLQNPTATGHRPKQ